MEESASGEPTVQKGALNHLHALQESTVEVKHYQRHQRIVLLDSFVIMAPILTDPQMVLLEMNVRPAPTVHLGVLLPRPAPQGLTQMQRAMDSCKTVLTALVGITVKGLVTKNQQINVTQATSVLLDKMCQIPMVLSALLDISVLRVQKNLSDVQVEHTRIQPIKYLVK